MGQEIAIQAQPQVPAFGLSDLERIATAIARGGLFGSKDPHAVLTLCMLAQAEGQHPAVVFRDYDLIQGKPAKKAEAMLRDFMNSGGKVTWNRLDDECADATFSHPQGGTVTINWTMARAAKAQLGGKDMWKKYPRQMLRSRVVSEGVRTVCPNATSGLYVPEEVRDFASDSTPTDTPATPEPKRARDLTPKQKEAAATANLISHTDTDAVATKARAKAEDWLSWLKDEVEAVGGEVEAVRTIFADAAPTLVKLEKEFPDLHAEAMQLAPTEEPATEIDEEHPGKAIADAIIAEIESPECNAVLDVGKVLNKHELDLQAMREEDAARVEKAADARRASIRAQQQKAKEGAEG
jgi:hypothetical protein